ncbi:MAG: hypothetical protein ACR2N0_04300 [Rubrobacteraceae bacterium]
MTATLSNRLATERHRAFVGRAAELELFRAALKSCALVRHTTEGVLEKMLSMPEIHELFHWLRSLAIVESGPLGLLQQLGAIPAPQTAEA